MRKVLPYMGAALSALAMVWSTQAMAQDQFKDLDPKHWAYEAVNELQQKGILIGYPDGYFKGKRTLTRYEFAIAIKRLLDKIQLTPGPAGAAGATGEAGPAGPEGPPGMTPEEVANLRRLTEEFRNELASLGASIRDINNRLDALAKELHDLEDRFNKQIKWSGSLFVGASIDRSRAAFIDYSGAVRVNANAADGLGGNNGLSGTATVINDEHLIGSANLPGGTKAVVDLDMTNYFAYRGGSLTGGPAAIGALGAGGTPQLNESIIPYQAYASVPLGGPKSASTLVIGRYELSGTPLTYYRPSLDAYFDIPAYDNGKYVQDGFLLDSKLGSVGLKLWAASYATVTESLGGSSALALNAPLFGGGPVGNSGFPLSGKPYGIDVLGNQAAANQGAGIGLGIPLFNAGTLNVGVTMLSTDTQASSIPFTDAEIYDVNLKLNHMGKLNVYAEAAKSVTSLGLNNGDGQPNDDNNAFLLHVGYNSGPVDASIGYNYIDPRFGAPGDWLKLGNWWNPTDLEGGFLKLGLKVNDMVSLHIGGDLLEGARNRPGYIMIGDRIDRAEAGVKFKLNKVVTLSGDYEGDFYDISNSGLSGLGQAGTKPVEQYITLGAGFNLSTNAVLKLSYQMINWDAIDNSGIGLNGSTGPIGAGGNTSNASVITTQLSVHF